MKSTGLRYVPLALVACVFWGVNDAEAQVKAPRRIPAPTLKRNRNSPLSPYLNVAAADGDTDAATFGYFQLTRPQQNAQRFAAQQRRENQFLQSELDAQRELLQQSPTSSLGTTGHKVQFMNYGNYYRFNK